MDSSWYGSKRKGVLSYLFIENRRVLEVRRFVSIVSGLLRRIRRVVGEEFGGFVRGGGVRVFYFFI